MGETVEQCHTNVHLGHLTLSGLGHHALAHQFEGGYFALDQAAPMGLTPFLPNARAQALTTLERPDFAPAHLLTCLSMLWRFGVEG